MGTLNADLDYVDKKRQILNQLQDFPIYYPQSTIYNLHNKLTYLLSDMLREKQPDSSNDPLPTPAESFSKVEDYMIVYDAIYNILAWYNTTTYLHACNKEEEKRGWVLKRRYTLIQNLHDYMQESKRDLKSLGLDRASIDSIANDGESIPYEIYQKLTGILCKDNLLLLSSVVSRRQEMRGYQRLPLSTLVTGLSELRGNPVDLDPKTEEALMQDIDSLIDEKRNSIPEDADFSADDVLAKQVYNEVIDWLKQFDSQGDNQLTPQLHEILNDSTGLGNSPQT